jgi:hypothetical protein
MDMGVELTKSELEHWPVVNAYWVVRFLPVKGKLVSLQFPRTEQLCDWLERFTRNLRRGWPYEDADAVEITRAYSNRREEK